MTEIEVLRTDLVPSVEQPDALLMRLNPLPARAVVDTVRPSSAMLSALTTLGLGSAELQTAIRSAAKVGDGLAVTFPPEVISGLRNGSLHLMKSADGFIPTAVDASHAIVSNARVVGGVTAAGGVAGGAAIGATATALAVAALPIVIAGAAAYAQQRQLNNTLDEIKEMVQQIEARLEDSDSGVCDAAERFLSLAQDALADGGFTEYLELELAAQRTAVEGLYCARKQWVDRFKKKLEAGADRPRAARRTRPAVGQVRRRTRQDGQARTGAHALHSRIAESHEAGCADCGRARRGGPRSHGDEADPAGRDRASFAVLRSPQPSRVPGPDRPGAVAAREDSGPRQLDATRPHNDQGTCCSPE